MAATERFEMRVPAEQMVLLRQAALDAKESMTMFVLTAALNRAQGAPEIMPAVEKTPKVHASPKPAVQKVVQKVQKAPAQIARPSQEREGMFLYRDNLWHWPDEASGRSYTWISNRWVIDDEPEKIIEHF